MRRTALVIGSQTGGLTGPHRDVEIMADVLSAHGFDVRRHTESAATSRAIVEAYESLIQDSSSDDAVVVYYSGHGSRDKNLKRTGDEPAFFQWIVPYDIDDRTNGFNGILAEELSSLQWRLTEKTENVTTILDCCHSARMFRDPDTVPRASTNPFPWREIAERVERVRAAGIVGGGDVNPRAVQIVACGPDQSAYERPHPALGGVHGALTAELVNVLRRPEAQAMSWREVIELVRPAILDVLPAQRPDLLGERSARDRLLFSTAIKDSTGVLPVGISGSNAWLRGASLFGVAEGDRYHLVAPGGDVRNVRWTGTVARVEGDRAILTLGGVTAGDLPAGVLAHPLEVALGRRPVAVRPHDQADRERVVARLSASRHVRVSEDDAVMSTVQLDNVGAQLLDAGGEPLWVAPRPIGEPTLDALSTSLRTLARATHVRDLDSGDGPTALPDDVDVAFSILLGGEELPLTQGEHVFDGDRIVVRATNRSAELRFVSVLDIGLSGAVTIQTNGEPTGAAVVAGQELVVGTNGDNVLEGIELYWPPDLPRGEPRPESIVVIVADASIDGLPALEQAGIVTRTAVRGARSAIEQLIEDVAVGVRDARPPATSPKRTRYSVHRLDLVVHPTPRPAADGEPPFEIDDRPDPSTRLIVPRGTTTPPTHVSVRLNDLVVHSNRAFLKAKVRVDFLIVSAVAADGELPYRAATMTVDRVRDGDRLPFDRALLYDGPVHRFLDLAVWVSRGDHDQPQLADLLAGALNDQDVAGSVRTLAGLAIAAPRAALVAASMAAVGTLVKTSANLIRTVVGDSIGVYRTSFLPHERFGAGEPDQRHPASGMIRAQDMSVAFEVVNSSPGGA